jgi:hypothetical protein
VCSRLLPFLYPPKADPRSSGRARIKSNIQNVLIVTKARDNRLIALTRDLALYIMKKRRQNGRGLVVYVTPPSPLSLVWDADVFVLVTSIIS